MWFEEHGIDTFSFYYKLTSEQYRDIIERLDEFTLFKEVISDDRSKTYIYLSDFYAYRGIKIWVSCRKGKQWELMIVVHPTLLLEDWNRSKPYQPKDKDEYQEIVKEVDRHLKSMNVPCSVDKTKLYRVHVASNLICAGDTPFDEHMPILKKSILLPHYRLDSFRKKDHKAKDCKRANKHSYKQYCKSDAFFAYDRVAQSEMIDTFPLAMISNRTLRLEVQLWREGMKKWVGKEGMNGSNWSIIKKLGERSEEILLWYLDHLQPAGDIYLHYSDVLDQIEGVKGKETRERMRYLLEGTRDSESLTAALDKLREKYSLSKSQCKTVLKEFEKLGISPITLPNSSGEVDVDSLSIVLRWCFSECEYE